MNYIVFLQVSPITPEFTLQASEVAETFCKYNNNLYKQILIQHIMLGISLRYLLQDPIVAYSPIKDAKPNQSGQKLPWPSTVNVAAIPLKSRREKTLFLWGMTLRMTQEIVGMKISRTVMTEEEYQEFKIKQAAKL